MQQLDIPVLDSREICRRRQPRVFVAGWLRRDLKVLSWEHLPPPKFGRCRLTLQDINSAPVQMEDIGSLPAVGEEVRIESVDAPEERFLGIVADRLIEAGEHGEELLIDVASQLADSLGVAIDRRFVLRGEDAITIQDVPIKFNAGTGTFASADEHTVGESSAKVFDTSVNAERWSLADAIRYLLAAFLPAAVSAGNADDLPALCGGLDLGECDVTGMSLGEALTELAHRAGLEIRAASDGLGVVFYQAGRQGRRRSLRLQQAGETLDLAASNLAYGRFSVGRRPAGATVTAIGAAKRYEATFALQPGWDRSLETPRWRDFLIGQSPDFAAFGDVYRKWVLNEHSWYADEPWSLPVHDFSSVGGDDFQQTVARKFLPCISSDTDGESLGVVVQYRCGSGVWRRWAGPVWVSGGECAVYLGGDGLPADYFQAVVDGNVSLRVTAAVAADAHITADATSGNGGERQVIDLSHRAAWRKVHESSIFHAAAPGTPDERDDTELLGRLAQMHADSAVAAVRAELTLGWIDTSFRPGDIIAAVEGRDLALNSNMQSLPAVRSVRHDFSRRHCTTLTVSG